MTDSFVNGGKSVRIQKKDGFPVPKVVDLENGMETQNGLLIGQIMVRISLIFRAP